MINFRKIFSLCVCFVLLISSIACKPSNDAGDTVQTNGAASSDDNAEETSDVLAEATTTAATDEPTAPDAPIVPQEPFYVGYAKADITPEQFPISVFGKNQATAAADKLYATVVALSDGENTALVITIDLQAVTDVLLFRATAAARELGIPSDNVMLCATHNHSGVGHHYETNEPNMPAWRAKYARTIKEAIRNAVDDLAPAEAYIGTANTEGFAFVRRYVMSDGSFRSIGMPSTSYTYVSHESEADPELQVIRFDREDKKDVVIVNWQAHAAHAVGMFNNLVTADFVANFRSGSEEKYGVEFAYYQGACGNINLSSYVSGKQIYKNYIQVGNALVDKLGEALGDMTPVRTGTLKAQKEFYNGEVDHSTDRFADHAKKALAAYNSGEVTTNDEMYKKYALYSDYHASTIITRAGLGKTQKLPISVISFGDIAFASTPYEMFDINGMQVKDGSPFKMTFVCGYTNGSYGYVPSTDMYDHGGYEVYSTRFVKGTGDAVAARLIEILKEQYGSGHE